MTTKRYLQRASADIGLMMAAYNLRRLMNILGIEGLSNYLAKVVNLLLRVFFKSLSHILCIFKINQPILQPIFIQPANRVYLIQNRNDDGGF